MEGKKGIYKGVYEQRVCEQRCIFFPRSIPSGMNGNTFVPYSKAFQVRSFDITNSQSKSITAWPVTK